MTADHARRYRAELDSLNKQLENRRAANGGRLRLADALWEMQQRRALREWHEQETK